MNSDTKSKIRRFGIIGFTASILAGQIPCAAIAAASDSTEEIIQLLEAKNIITAEEADQIISRHRSAPAVQGSTKPVTVVVPEGQRYLETVRDSVAKDIKQEVARQVKQELKKEIAEEVKLEAYTGSVPGWTKRIRFGGDIRLRGQGNYFQDSNAQPADPSDPTRFLNREVDENELRYRVRVSANAKVNDQTEVGIRLATGNEENPISTNDTLGDNFNKDTITFDLAYLRLTPVPETSTWTGKMDFWGGRFPNPFYTTDLVYDSDLNFEGVAATTEIPINTRLKGIANVGYFPLDEIDFSTDDKRLWGGQLGVEYAPRPTVTYTLALAYYDYENIKGKRNPYVVNGEGPYDYTAPRVQQAGNTIFDINQLNSGDTLFALASDYKEVTLTGKIEAGFFDPIYVTLEGDYVKNVGYDEDEVNELTGEDVPKDDTGYKVSLSVGYPKIEKLWDWQASLFYKYLEADAVLDAFTDSDFHLGGTNAKGWGIGGQLGIMDNVWLRASWLSSDEISGPPVEVDTLQIDVNSRF